MLAETETVDITQEPDGEIPGNFSALASTPIDREFSEICMKNEESPGRDGI